MIIYMATKSVSLVCCLLSECVPQNPHGFQKHNRHSTNKILLSLLFHEKLPKFTGARCWLLTKTWNHACIECLIVSYCLISIYNMHSFIFDPTWTTLATGKHMTLVTLVSFLLTFCLIFFQEAEVDIVVQSFTKVAKRTGHTTGFWPLTSVLVKVGSLNVVGFASMVQRWSMTTVDSIWSRVIVFKILKTVTVLFHLSVMTFPNKRKKHGIMFGIRKNRFITLVQQHREI